MRADTNDHGSQAQIESLLQHEERKSERYANYARLLFTVLYFAVVLAIHDELPAHSLIASSSPPVPICSMQ